MKTTLTQQTGLKKAARFIGANGYSIMAIFWTSIGMAMIILGTLYGDALGIIAVAGALIGMGITCLGCESFEKAMSREEWLAGKIDELSQMNY